MRTFIAIEVPSHTKAYLAHIQNCFKQCNLHAKWVAPQNMHLTLKFLGEIDQATLPLIKKQIGLIKKHCSAFRASLDRFGFFPNRKHPRVFFVETGTGGKLKELAHTLEELLEVCGFKKEGRFKSHITLARFKSTKNIDSLKRELEKLSLEGDFLINEITVFKSTLTGSGPIYQALWKMSLDKEEEKN